MDSWVVQASQRTQTPTWGLFCLLCVCHCTFNHLPSAVLHSFVMVKCFFYIYLNLFHYVKILYLNVRIVRRTFSSHYGAPHLIWSWVESGGRPFSEQQVFLITWLMIIKGSPEQLWAEGELQLSLGRAWPSQTAWVSFDALTLFGQFSLALEYTFLYFLDQWCHWCLWKFPYLFKRHFKTQRFDGWDSGTCLHALP